MAAPSYGWGSVQRGDLGRVPLRDQASFWGFYKAFGYEGVETPNPKP